MLGFSPGTAVIAPPVGVINAWIIAKVRHAESMVTPEMRTAAMGS